MANVKGKISQAKIRLSAGIFAALYAVSPTLCDTGIKALDTVTEKITPILQWGGGFALLGGVMMIAGAVVQSNNTGAPPDFGRALGPCIFGGILISAGTVLKWFS